MRYDDVHYPDSPAARGAAAPPVRLEYGSQFPGHPLKLLGRQPEVHVVQGGGIPPLSRLGRRALSELDGDSCGRSLLAHLGQYYAPYSTASVTRPWDTDDLLETVGLTAHARKRVRSLSGGQRRRLDVAIGIVGRPELLFLDEPTAGFDPEARRDFHDVVHRLTDREKTTILLTTHDLDEAERLADRILILAGGTIVADGSADELARAMPGQSEVRWSRDGRRFVQAADDATAFVRELFRRYGESVEELEVRRASLEDTYLALVRQAERGVPPRLTAAA